MTALIVPVPTVEPAGVAVLERPVELRSGSATRPDGSPLAQHELSAFGYLVYRRLNPVAPEEVWDDAAGAWMAAAATDPAGLRATPLAFEPNGPRPWFSVLVAAGQDHFAPAVAGYPRYRFRTFAAPAEGVDADAALSGPTPDVHFVGVMDALRAGINIGPGQTPETATEVHLFLRGPALQLMGAVSIFNEGGQARIQLARWGAGPTPLTRLSLEADGTVRLNDALEISTSGSDATIRCPAGRLTLSGVQVHAQNFSFTP